MRAYNDDLINRSHSTIIYLTGDNMNKFLNENWPVILNELKPGIQDAFGAAFGDISNRIFHKVPYNKIFP
jgi:hypothetical protein